MKIKTTTIPTYMTFGCIATSLALSNHLHPAYAEGDINFQGAQGVNRVIRSTPGAHATTSGVATLSFDGLPPEGGGYLDKPSLYLGAAIGINEVDAGIEYEPRIVNNVDQGWTAFISVSRGGATPVYTNPRVVRASDEVSIPWRGGPVPEEGELISGSIQSSVAYQTHSNGRVSVTIGALRNTGQVAIVENSGTFFYNIAPGANTASSEHRIAPWYGGDSLDGDQNQIRIKRVTAMTRDSGGSTPDGSYLMGTWAGAFDAPISHTQDRHGTGYDAPGNGDPQAKDGAGNYKVNFPFLNVTTEIARTDVPPSRAATQSNTSRYSIETVEINLRRRPTRGLGLGGVVGGGGGLG